MKKNLIRQTVALLIFCFFNANCLAALTRICSTEHQPWRKMPEMSLQSADRALPPQVRIALNKTYQQIDGFDGCFNELGWRALGGVSESERTRAMNGLLSSDGCAFKMSRVPIGASDFATGAYSLDDVAGDFALTHFPINRDKTLLIPFIKAAMQIQPDLQCWAFPWSPPAWMKTNNNYSKGEIKFQPEILASYAQYLARWIASYQRADVHIFAVCPQNEPNIWNDYPTCHWSGEQLRKFIADDLGPTLTQQKSGVQIWLGNIEPWQLKRPTDPCSGRSQSQSTRECGHISIRR